MANHQSALKRIRQTVVRTVRNKFYHKSARTAIKKLRSETDKKVAEDSLPKVSSLIDQLAKRNIIHKNKAGNLKSSLTKHVASL